MKCPKCNAEVPDGTEFCHHCGKRLIKRKTSKYLRIGAVAAIAIVVILLVLAFAPIATARVIVTVHSDHSVYTISYKVYINGEPKAEGSLAAGASRTHTIDVQLGTGIFSESTVVVMASSTGGGWGATSDQTTLKLSYGDSEAVTLRI
jgi:predicted nucleic acid-binding Zn ribbon protein